MWTTIWMPLSERCISKWQKIHKNLPSLIGIHRPTQNLPKISILLKDDLETITRCLKSTHPQDIAIHVQGRCTVCVPRLSKERSIPRCKESEASLLNFHDQCSETFLMIWWFNFIVLGHLKADQSVSIVSQTSVNSSLLQHFIQNNWTNFKRTSHKISLGKAMPPSKGR